MKVRYTQAADLLKVDNPIVGRKYHLTWAQRGCVWILKEINTDGVRCLLQTPRTKKYLVANLSDLRHTRKEQFKIEQKFKNT